MSKIPETIGKYLAQFQDMVDRVVEYGAKKLDAIEDTPTKEEEKKEPETIAEKTVSLCKGFLKGIGRMGKSYYKEYETLKEEKMKDGKDL